MYPKLNDGFSNKISNFKRYFFTFRNRLFTRTVINPKANTVFEDKIDTFSQLHNTLSTKLNDND